MKRSITTTGNVHTARGTNVTHVCAWHPTCVLKTNLAYLAFRVRIRILSRYCDFIIIIFDGTNKIQVNAVHNANS